MELINQIREAERYNTEIEAKIKLIDSQISKLLIEGGFETLEEALNSYNELKEKLPEYETKLLSYLEKVKKLIEV